MLTSEAKKQILMSVLETIRGISDKKYQERVWIRGEGPEVDDFDETCCNFFGDGEPLLESYKDFGLTESQYFVLEKFRDKFRSFSDGHYHPLEFIETPEWAEIMNLAKEVLKLFNYPRQIDNQMLAGFIKNAKKFCAMAAQEKMQICAEEFKCEDLYQSIFEMLAEDCILKDRNNIGITEDKFKLLKNLSRVLRNFVDKYEIDSAKKITKKLMDVPEWREINHMSQMVVQAFDLENKEYNDFG